MPAGQRGPLSTRGTAVRRWRDSFPATAANRFHKGLRFFFSLLKRKKEAKKEKSSRFTCTTRSSITRRSHAAIPRRGEQAAAAAVTLPFLQLKLGRKVSGDSPQKSSRCTCTMRQCTTRRLHINKNNRRLAILGLTRRTKIFSRANRICLQYL